MHEPCSVTARQVSLGLPPPSTSSPEHSPGTWQASPKVFVTIPLSYQHLFPVLFPCCPGSKGGGDLFTFLELGFNRPWGSESLSTIFARQCCNQSPKLRGSGDEPPQGLWQTTQEAALTVGKGVRKRTPPPTQKAVPLLLPTPPTASQPRSEPSQTPPVHVPPSVSGGFSAQSPGTPPRPLARPSRGPSVTPGPSLRRPLCVPCPTLRWPLSLPWPVSQVAFSVPCPTLKRTLCVPRAFPHPPSAPWRRAQCATPPSATK